MKANMSISATVRVLTASALLFLQVEAKALTKTFAIIGDAGKVTSNAQSVQASIRRAGVKSLVLPGDNLYSSTYEKVWNSWSDMDFSVVAIGNHNDGYQNEIDYFNMPAEYYSKTFEGGLRFLVLNSDNTTNVASQMKWLDSELQKEANMTFLVWHHPTYTLTSFHNWEEKYQFQTAARNLIHKYSDKITALILGHDHIAAYYCANKIPLIVSGAVQETRYPETKNYKAEDNVQVIPQWVYPPNTPTWARLDIDTDALTVNVSFIRASDDKVMFNSKLTEAPKTSLCRK
ncbi:MAG: metallophosphoesterase [Proteobacteria bacterium]|nr:metallophosphoesterase [Pseudomonadota bacterium]